jgi:pyruvate dehydrogenase E1 component alpha subunit
MNIPNIPKEKLKEIYTKMTQTRHFEETAARLFTEGKVHGTAHFCIGEEATGIGVCCALDKEDYIAATHRGHNQSIGKGMSLDRMMAEFLGKETGYCKGKGGCMHIADFSVGSLGANGIVGGGIPIAVGAALSQKMRKDPHMTVGFFGDGASNEGSFHESVNLAAVWKLPVLFVCVNNLYAMSTPIEKQMNISDLSQRALAYGIRGVAMDGNDAIAVYLAALEAKEYVKANGPMLLVLNTYRIMGHSKSDANVYRTKQEIEQWKKRDPIPRMRRQLLAEKIFTAAELDAIEAQSKKDVEAAVRFAEASPNPKVENVLDDVYAKPGMARPAEPWTAEAGQRGDR